MKKITLSLFVVFVTISLIQTPSIFADQIDIQSIQLLYETIYKIQDLQLQQEILQQLKNLIHGPDLEIPSDN